MKLTKDKLARKIQSTKVSLNTGIQKFLIRYSQRLNKPLNKPTSIIFNLTPNCVLRCKQCDIWQNPPEKHLSLENGRLIIDKLHSWLGQHYVFFTGGEPLMNRDLPQMISHAKSLGILSHINTNAFLIDDALAQKLIDCGVYALSISLDGAKASTHDYLRGRQDTFNRATKAIKTLYRLSPDQPKIYINTVMMKDNVSELTDLVSLAHELHSAGITFQCLLPNLGPKGSSFEPSKNPLWPETKTVVRQIEKLLTLKKNDDIILTSTDDLNTAISYYQNPAFLHNLTCQAGINNFIIDHLGDVRLCFRFPPIGNILTDSPSELWNSKLAQKQREQIRLCQQSCKIIACNKANLSRGQAVAFRLFG